MEINSKTQEETFKELIAMKYKIQGLAGYIQNDYGRLLEEKHITVEDLDSGFKSMQNDFDQFIGEIHDIKERAENILTHYILINK